MIPHLGYGYQGDCSCGCTGCPEVCVQMRSSLFDRTVKPNPPAVPRNRHERRKRAALERNVG